MNRSATQLIQANRPATHRLRRRSALARPVCAMPAVVAAPVMAPEIVAGLPHLIVREAGMLELLAAQMRIADLEKALAEATAAATTDPFTGALDLRGREDCGGES